METGMGGDSMRLCAGSPSSLLFGWCRSRPAVDTVRLCGQVVYSSSVEAA
ncbi:hypothetical protein GA0070617_1546 [Micromonospora yangpuensis]|uniref:Uncharacterized protein n=1 Tax=Micromonospora yangpuensis TaxID=683228 RepID=A0A1C6U9D6_9ACTN|nr:hypothetical protein GA0070617_1546 [Micromonospora yangpuensis]